MSEPFIKKHNIVPGDLLIAVRRVAHHHEKIGVAFKYIFLSVNRDAATGTMMRVISSDARFSIMPNADLHSRDKSSYSWILFRIKDNKIERLQVR